MSSAVVLDRRAEADVPAQPARARERRVEHVERDVAGADEVDVVARASASAGAAAPCRGAAARRTARRGSCSTGSSTMRRIIGGSSMPSISDQQLVQRAAAAAHHARAGDVDGPATRRPSVPRNACEPLSAGVPARSANMRSRQAVDSRSRRREAGRARRVGPWKQVVVRCSSARADGERAAERAQLRRMPTASISSMKTMQLAAPLARRASWPSSRGYCTARMSMPMNMLREAGARRWSRTAS